MSSVAEAASLFGAPDPADDPFASSLGGTDEPADSGLTNSNDLFGGSQDSSAADFFSNTYPADSDPFPASTGTAPASYHEPVTRDYGNTFTANTANHYSTQENGSTYQQQQGYGSTYLGYRAVRGEILGLNINTSKMRTENREV